MRSLTRLVLLLFVVVTTQNGKAQSTQWQTMHPGFRVTALTAHEGSIWVSGAGGAIASSTDGEHWQIRHQHTDAGPLLLGIGFSSSKFGYAYGVGGAVFTSENGGETWIAHPVNTGTILTAAFSSPNFGIVRTREKLFFFHGTPSPHEISDQGQVLSRFSYVSGLAALDDERFGALVREGEFSEGGFLTTTDGGATWSFYDPPSSGVRSFLNVDGTYWAVGHEVINGGGTPLAMFSSDGRTWERTKNNIRPCHWEVCRGCTVTGCVASSTLLVDPFHGATAFTSIPKGVLTTRWAWIPATVCTLNFGLQCVTPGIPADIEAMPVAGAPEPDESYLLGTPAKTLDGLVCIECAVDRRFTGDEGSPTVRAELVIGTDGAVKSAKIKGSPKVLQETIQRQVEDWLFEPPLRDGKSVEAAVIAKFSVAVPRVQRR